MPSLPLRFRVLSPADHAVAALFLEDAANPPDDDDLAGRAAFRAKWAPWLWHRAPGPIGARGRKPAA